MIPAPVLQALNLKVAFPARNKIVTALDGVDLEIPSGALFVLLGPNGAGKTTLMRCITGLVKPTSGTISVFGAQVDLGARNRKRNTASTEPAPLLNRLARLGVLIENPGLYGRMDARAYLQFFAPFYTIPDLENRILELCQAFDLHLSDKPVAKLSQGNRQKLQLIRTLLHKPDFLLWDEPTDHLDPVSQKQVLLYLKNYLKQTGATALVATHRLEQMESVASHFGFLVQGKLVCAGTRDAILEGEKKAEAFRLGFLRQPSQEEWQGIPEEFGISLQMERESDSPLSSAPSVNIQGQDLQKRMPLLLTEILKRGMSLATVEPIRPNLSDIYARWVTN